MKPKFIITPENVSIEIPIAYLNHLATTAPDTKVKILNQEKFIERLVFNLENDLGGVETGLTGFEELLDKAIEDAIESDSESLSVEFTD
jgi:hypothetical protein